MLVNVVGLDGAVKTEETWWAEALELKAALATSKLRLYKSGAVTINAGTTAAELEAAECDFDAYAEHAISVVGDPYRDSDGTVLVTVPAYQFNWEEVEESVANDVGGAWIEDTSGDVRVIVPFPEPKTMATAEDAIVFQYTFRVGEAS